MTDRARERSLELLKFRDFPWKMLIHTDKLSRHSCVETRSYQNWSALLLHAGFALGSGNSTLQNFLWKIIRAEQRRDHLFIVHTAHTTWKSISHNSWTSSKLLVQLPSWVQRDLLFQAFALEGWLFHSSFEEFQAWRESS